MLKSLLIWSLQPWDGDAGGSQKDAEGVVRRTLGGYKECLCFPHLTPTTPGCRSPPLKSPPTVEKPF